MEHGLSSAKAADLLIKYGRNEIPQHKQTLLERILKIIVSPITIMLLTASILSFVTGKLFDSGFILFLIVLNIIISVWQENKADSAIQKLNDNLASETKVIRDGKWITLDSRLLVPGDVIELSIGEIIPADGKILDTKHATIDESALTGESLPQEKEVGAVLYSGSFMSSGLLTLEITATGKNSYFGKTLFSVEHTRKQSLLEKDIIRISQFLTVLSIVTVIILTCVLWLKKAPLIEVLTLDLSLIIAGVPISLPTVLTLIIEFGVIELAKKKLIVRRISALEDLANVDMVLTDKTGTLTQNKITVETIHTFEGFQEKDVITLASLSASKDDHNPINKSILEYATHHHISAATYDINDYVAADSVRKRSTVETNHEGKKVLVSVGAPQVIQSLCHLSDEKSIQYTQLVEHLAAKGSRTLAVAIADGSEEKHMQLVGLLELSDTLRHDAPDVIKFMKDNAIHIAMLTGDNQAIASEIARRLDLNDGITISSSELKKIGYEHLKKEDFINTAAFAEILPEDKYKLVQTAKKYFVVAANGDGINDIPPIKEANVGFAVASAVSALKSSADIVLLSDGIAVIRDAIIESRKIFSRVYTYSIYRISESLRLILTIGLIGFFNGQYPLTSLQIILLALLNDIPIISLAFDRVKTTNKPSKINVLSRFMVSSVLGMVGVVNSMLLFCICLYIFHLPWALIETLFFLKLTVGGHMLIFISHTREHWYNFLPSKQVMIATLTTQAIATLFAFFGWFMPAPLPLPLIALVWIWCFAWMQVSDYTKTLVKD